MRPYNPNRMAYNGHSGVKYRRYDESMIDEDTDEYQDPECVIDTVGELDELYFESYSGSLCVTVQVADEYVSLEIPVKADTDWNEFVASLPAWE